MPAAFGLGKSRYNLDLFHDTTRRFLEARTRDLGHDPARLAPVINVAIEYSKEETSKMIAKSNRIFPHFIVKSRMEELAYHYVEGSLMQSKKWEDAKACIKSYSSFFLVGAGISFESGVPLTHVLQRLLRFCGAECYEDLRKDGSKQERFQLEFKRICDEKEIGLSHRLIAVNFPRHILEVICLNWDNLLERAFRKLAVAFHKINKDRATKAERYLWKFHGDVEDVYVDSEKGKGGWVFPDEEGYVFDCFVEYIDKTGLKDRIFTFVVAGYSEKDKEICDRIIEYFEEKPPRPTFRIGLDLSRLHEDNYIVGPSDFVLERILPATY